MYRRSTATLSQVIRSAAQAGADGGQKKIISNRTFGGSSLFPKSETEYVIGIPKFKLASEAAMETAGLNASAKEAEDKVKAAAEAHRAKVVIGRHEVVGEGRERVGATAQHRKTKPEHVMVTGEGPTLAFDFSADDADFTYGNEAKREMEEFRRRLTPQNWKAFLQVLDRAAGEPGFEKWAETVTLEQMYTGLMKEHRKQEWRNWRKKWTFIPMGFLGMYSLIWPFHFFKMF